jgi:predicted Zn-dependent peptidase
MEETSRPGGIKCPQLLVAADPRLRTTSVCLSVNCGSRHDPAGLGGLAHMLEHLLVSVPLAGGASLSERVERMGGDVNAETGLDQMRFYARVHADDADDVASMLLDSVLSPVLAPESLDAEREVVLQELAGAAADPNDTVQDAMLAALFPEHPLGRPVGGTAEEVRLIEPADVYSHLESVFLRRPMTMAVVGPRAVLVRPESARADFAQDTDETAVWRDHVPLTPVRRPELRWPDEYAWVCLGARSPELGNPSRAVYTVLADLFGSSSASLLYRRLRNELGLVYSFHAWERAYAETGAWRVLVGVDVGKGDAVVDAIHALLQDVADCGVAEHDLQAARSRAEVRLTVSTEDPMERAQLIADRAAYRIPEWSAESELERLQSVTSDQLAQAAKAIQAGLVAVVRPEG